MPRDFTGYLDALEEELGHLLAEEEELTAPIYRMMQYHLGWLDGDLSPVEGPRGKRLRPVLCLLACEAVGGDWRRAVPAAAAIELTHNFSLIHDDIEDWSDTRRHQPTVWKMWGIAQGINTGDAMWAISRLAIHRLSQRGYEAEVVLRVGRRLDRTCLELCTGQYLDIAFEKADEVSLADYERMIAGKTAALLSASAACGAILGGAASSLVEAYGAFSRELGLAFQITDDILGIWGDTGVTGKSTASDLVSKKKTLPVLYAMNWEREAGYQDLVRAYAHPTLAPETVPAVLSLLDRAGAVEYAHSRMREHHRLALAHLEATQVHNPAQDALKHLACSLLERTF